MVKSCCAYRCQNEWTPNGTKKFHKFPIKNKQRLDLWLKAVRRKNFAPTANSVICGDHFEVEDYLESSLRQNILKPDAVPSVFIYVKNPSNKRRKLERENCESSVFNNNDIETEIKPPVPLVTLVKTEPLAVIKKEPLEEALKEDIKDDIDIVYHSLSEDFIKSETVLEDILEKHSESVQTQAFGVKAENSPFIKKENITQRNESEGTSDGNVSRGTGQGMVVVQARQNSIKSEILESKHCESVETQVFVKAENSPFIQADKIIQRNKTGDTSDENVSKGTGQAVVEVQGSNEYSNVLGNLETDEQYVLNFSKNLNGIRVRSRKSKSTKKTDFAKCHKTVETTSWGKDKEKIKVIKAPVIPIEAHEYICLAKDKYVCNHCQHAYNALNNLRRHIKLMHRKLTTTYQCPYCPYYDKLKGHLKNHIILKHKDTKDIEWFQCNLCEVKFKLKTNLTQHMKIHLKHKQMKDGLNLNEKRYHCNNCDYKTDHHQTLKMHNLVHLKPEETQYFYCYHCSFETKWKESLKGHIFRHHFENAKQAKRYGCNECGYETYKSGHLKSHKLTHLKPEEIQYFYCYNCSYKAKRKGTLKRHILTYFKKEQAKFHCYI